MSEDRITGLEAALTGWSDNIAIRACSLEQRGFYLSLLVLPESGSPRSPGALAHILVGGLTARRTRQHLVELAAVGLIEVDENGAYVRPLMSPRGME